MRSARAARWFEPVFMSLMPELLFWVELFMVPPVEPLEEPIPVPVPVVPELELPVLFWLVVPEGVVVLPEPMEPEPEPEPVLPVCACAVPAAKAKEATKTAVMRLKETVM